MDYVKELLKWASLSKYNMELQQEWVRTFSMTIILSVIVFCFPYWPSRSNIFCVHSCVLGNRFFTENMSLACEYYYNKEGCFNEFDGELYYDKACLVGCLVHTIRSTEHVRPYVNQFGESFRDPRNHECRMRHRLDEAYLRERKKEVGNTICPHYEIRRNIQFFGALFAAYMLFLVVQISWLFTAQDALEELAGIHSRMRKEGRCKSCIEKFIKRRKNCKACRLCDHRPMAAPNCTRPDSTSIRTAPSNVRSSRIRAMVARNAYRRRAASRPGRNTTPEIQNPRNGGGGSTVANKLSKIDYHYKWQNLINLVYVILIVILKKVFGFNFELQFGCEIPTGISNEGYHQYLNFKYMTCLNPDAPMLTFAICLLYSLDVILMIFFIFNIVRQKICVKLCSSIRST